MFEEVEARILDAPQLEYCVSKLIEILYFWQCYEGKYHTCMHTAPRIVAI
jgi:hypothetical protein